MALKPDVTLSIVKNAAREQAILNNTVTAARGVSPARVINEKLYYTESVYRAAGNGGTFSEITQTGLEYIGKINTYTVCEVIALALESLRAVSPDYVLDISDMGILSGIITAAGGSDACRDEIIKVFSSRNSHELRLLCEAYSLPSDTVSLLSSLLNLYGPLDYALGKLSALPLPGECSEAFNSLRSAADMLSQLGAYNINLDFSVVNDMTYYNGLIFRGFIKDIPEGVLSGGRYDKLLHEMSRSTSSAVSEAGKSAQQQENGAIGFAVYLDVLSRFCESDSGAVDAAVIYDKNTDMAALSRRARALRETGKAVRVTDDASELSAVSEIIDMRGDGK